MPSRTHRAWFRSAPSALLMMGWAIAAGTMIRPERADAALSVVIVEHKDPWTNTAGLGELLADLKQPFKNVTAALASTRNLDLSGADVFIVGSFCTQNKTLREALAAAGPRLREWVHGGGFVIMLTQTDQDVAEEAWVPAPARVTRGDPDFARAYRVQPQHPLFNTPEAISDRQLQDWHYAAGAGRGWPTSWESFVGFQQVAVLAGDDAGAVTHACILEAGWGKGRALFLSLAPDKARNVGNAVAKAQAPRLMRNLLAYAEAVKSGRAGPVEVYVQKKTGYEGPIAGRVFSDLNGNGRYDDGEPGIAGVGVSDRTDIVTTAADGTYTVPNTAGDAEFVYISLPAGYSKWGKWYQRLAGAEPGEKFDFPLKAADERQPFTFAQVSDIHVGGSGTRELLAAGLAEIAAVKEGVAFVLATGDLVNVGSITKQYDDYVAGVATSRVPYFSVIGNHDTNDRGSANYRKYLGPDYYSFDYADCHFLIVNSMHKTPQQRAWIEQDLKLLRGRKRLFMFQHFAPSEEEHKLFASYGTEGVFTGHWHSQRTVKVGQMGSYNHPNFLFGGIDCSPAAFKLIRVEPGGIRTRMRYMADGKRLTIVTPNEALMIPQGDLLVVVDAYETAAEYVSMRFELKSGQTLVAEGELARQGDWNWRGAVPAGKIARGAYDLSVTATNDRGEQSTARSSFMVMAVKPAPAAAQTARSDWPQFGGGPQRGGVSDSGLEPPLAPVWYRHTGANFDAASPVLKDGTVYVGMKDRGDFNRNGVLALRAEDGEQLWFTPTPAAVSHSVAVDDRRVYACSHGGIVHAFDRAGGKPLWQQVLGSPVDRWQYAGPVVLGGMVFAGTYAYFGAFNAADGAPKWHKTFGPDWISSYSCPAAQGDVVVVAGNSQGKTPRAIRADTGEPVWEYATDERLHGSPVIADGRVVFTTYGGILHCADLATGRQRWKQPLEGGRSLSTPAVHNGVIVTGGTGSIRAYKLEDGSPLWSAPIGKSALKMAPYDNGYDALVGSPTIAGGLAYVPCGDGRLYALALETGKMIWCMDFGSPVVSAPCISGDRLYLTTFDGGVYCLAGRKSFAPVTN